MANGAVQIGKLEERMNVVEEGVANFRSFQTDVREFITRSDERAKQRAQQEQLEKEQRDKLDKKRARIHFWWLGLLSGAILLLFGAFLQWAANHHVSSQNHQQQVSEERQPQDARVPILH